MADVEKPFKKDHRWSNKGPGTPAGSENSTTRLARRTAAQVEKKRIQDRESQRNVRQRTKDYIASLEDKLETLQSTSCTSKLVAENEQLKLRVAELNRALLSISDLASSLGDKSENPAINLKGGQSRRCGSDSIDVQPLSISINNSVPEQSDSHSPALHPPGLSAAQDGSPGVFWQSARENGSIPSTATVGIAGGASSLLQKPDAIAIQHGIIPAAQALQSFWANSICPSNPMDSSGLDILSNMCSCNPDSVAQMWNMTSGEGPSIQDDDTDMNGPIRQEGAHAANLVDIGPNHSPSGTILNHLASFSDGSSTPKPATIFDPQIAIAGLTVIPVEQMPSAAGNMVMPQTCPPTNIWDMKLLSFISQFQALLLSHHEPSYFEPDTPDVTVLLNDTDLSICPNHITRFLSKSINLWNFNIPEKLAMFWLNYIYLKYRVSPTAKNIRHLPEWFLPRVSQCFSSHPIFIDTLPWPGLRDKMTFEYGNYPFEPFVAQFCASINVNWDRDVAETYSIHPDGSTTITPAFVAHLRKVENWTLTATFPRTYPELARELHAGVM